LLLFFSYGFLCFFLTQLLDNQLQEPVQLPAKLFALDPA